MLYMSPVDVSRVPLPVHPVVDVKGPMVPQVQGTYHVAHHGAAHQASPPPPYGMSYTTLVPCNIHPSQMNLTHTTDSQSDHSTNHSYLTRDSFPIHNGDVCEVWASELQAAACHQNTFCPDVHFLSTLDPSFKLTKPLLLQLWPNLNYSQNNCAFKNDSTL